MTPGNRLLFRVRIAVKDDVAVHPGHTGLGGPRSRLPIRPRHQNRGINQVDRQRTDIGKMQF
jgi:hypothetical protein